MKTKKKLNKLLQLPLSSYQQDVLREIQRLQVQLGRLEAKIDSLTTKE